MINRYQSPLMAKIWSDESKFAVWFLVERAYLSSYLAAENYPDCAALMARLDKKAETISWSAFAANVARYDQEVKHDVIAFLHALEDEVHDDARLIHRGLTSSDVVDTSFAYVLKQANDAIVVRLKAVIVALWQQAEQHRGVLCLGRTHGQAAEPTTFGLKLLSHVAELARGYHRLVRAGREIAVGKFSGAVGVYAFVTPAVEERALAALGLMGETIATQIVARDRHANYFASLAVLAGSIERFSTEMRLLMHGQVKEAFEPFSAKQKGSSAMPHKKNPVLSENLCGLMRMMRSYALASLENQALWHERDISHSSVERIIAPDATSLMEFALTRMLAMVKGMVVDKDRLRKNLDDEALLLTSQALMLALTDKGLMRQKAYELVQEAALRGQRVSFQERCSAVGIVDIIGDEQFRRVLRASEQIHHEDSLFERVREMVAAIGA